MKPTPAGLAHLAGELEALRGRGLLREPEASPQRGFVSLSSNDYLGLAARLCRGRAGAGGSRLVTGNHAEHEQLEESVCSWLQCEAALVFTSGYAANVGVLAALTGPNDLLVSDELNHASIIDGARLGRSRIVVVPHLDLDTVRRALRARRRGRAWVVTETYFSMDADSPNLAELRQVCDEGGAALIVDEAHALGVLGPDGRGLCAAAHVAPDVLVGTFGKAFGAAGAFVAGPRELIFWLWNRARPHVYSTGLSPVVARAAYRGLSSARTRPQLRYRALAVAKALREALSDVGGRVLGYGHVIPWLLGSSRSAVQVSRHLRGYGLHAVAIRPPSVPKGTARIRLAASARHRPIDIARFHEALRAQPCAAPCSL